MQLISLKANALDLIKFGAEIMSLQRHKKKIVPLYFSNSLFKVCSFAVPNSKQRRTLSVDGHSCSADEIYLVSTC